MNAGRIGEFCSLSPFLDFFFLFFLTFIYFWDRERHNMNREGSERRRHRIWSRFQALSCQHRAQRRAWTHRPWDHDLSRSQTLNRLSHPGAPSPFLDFIQRNPPIRWIVYNQWWRLGQPIGLSNSLSSYTPPQLLSNMICHHVFTRQLGRFGWEPLGKSW